MIKYSWLTVRYFKAGNESWDILCWFKTQSLCAVEFQCKAIPTIGGPPYREPPKILSQLLEFSIPFLLFYVHLSLLLFNFLHMVLMCRPSCCKPRVYSVTASKPYPIKPRVTESLHGRSSMRSASSSNSLVRFRQPHTQSTRKYRQSHESLNLSP